MKAIGSAWLACLLLVVAGHAGAAVVASGAYTIGASADLTARLPAVQTFNVATAGQVRITLSDLGAPQALTQLRLVVSRGGTKIASLDGAGNREFAATAGEYKVQVVGTPAQGSGAAGPAGTFQVEVRELAGNTVLKQFTDGMASLPAAPTAQSGLDTSVVLAAGTYQVTLSDRSFPAALSGLSLLLNPASATGGTVAIAGPCTTACTQSFTVTAAGSYDLFVVATAADPDQAGLYSLKISSNADGAVAYGSTQPVGKLAAATTVTLAAGAHTLSASDFATPLALSALRLRLAQGAELLAALDAAGSSVALTAAAGTAQLFTVARATGGAGVYGVGIAQGAQTAYRAVRTLPAGFDAALNAGGYGYEFAIPAAGNYRLRVRDLNFPAAFGQLRAVVLQGGVAVQSVSGTNVATSVMLAAGPASLAVIGSPATANASSLMGVSLAPQGGGTALLDLAQGIGASFSAQPVTIPVAGSHDVAISDLQFPAAFSDLAVAVTRGSELVGQVFGSNVLRFDAQQGVHAINLLARPDAAAKYGTWGFEVAATPPPTVTISAAPAAIAVNGTTLITWSTTGASSCTASGGWSGARATAGAETSPALGSATTFTLQCTGAGGSATGSATVTINASAKGGGGALGLGSLLLLAGMLRARRRSLRA